MAEDTRVYDVKQVAFLLQVCERTVRDMIKDGKIKKVSNMGAIRITHVEYIRFINGSE